jgi:hypothetical protein
MQQNEKISGRKMRRLLALSFTLLVLMLVAIPIANASCNPSCGCRHIIKVIPMDSTSPTKRGEPIITGNPANLMIFRTGRGLGSVKNVWLLIVLNEPTFNALVQINMNGSKFMEPSDFIEVTTRKIPPTTPDPTTGYPGSLCTYNVAAIKDKMNETETSKIYYGLKFLVNQISTCPTNFTLEIVLNSTVSLKALVLALGRLDVYCGHECGVNCIRYEPFNACSSFSKSTFMISEATTIALATAPFLGAGGFYLIRYKKKLK